MNFVCYNHMKKHGTCCVIVLTAECYLFDNLMLDFKGLKGRSNLCSWGGGGGGIVKAGKFHCVVF